MPKHLEKNVQVFKLQHTEWIWTSDKAYAKQYFTTIKRLEKQS